jgi:putative endopeptidase
MRAPKFFFAGLVFSCCFAYGQSSTPVKPSLTHFDPALVDRSLDPCDNFYKFVCSKWIAANPVPADQPRWETDSNLEIWNESILRDAMIEASNPSTQRDAVHQKVGDYWAACMDESGIEKNGLKSLQPIFDRIAAMKNKKELAEVVAMLHKSVPAAWAGADNQTNAALLGFGSQQDFNDSSLVIAGIDQGGLGMPNRDYYLSDNPKLTTVREKYIEHVKRMFTLAGDTPEQAAADANTVLKIETALAKIQMDNVSRRDPQKLNNVMTLAQVQALTPAFDWQHYLVLVGSPTPHHYVVSSPDFFRGAQQVLVAEPLANWKVYLRWWTLHGHARYLNSAFEEENFDFYGRTVTGSEKQLPRWRRCVAFADRDLGEALGQAYVEKAFPPDSKKRVEDMVAAIQKSLGDDINGLDWMSPETKKQALVKLTAMEPKIGYPKVWRDYSSVTITPTSLVDNVHQATAFEFKRQLNKIGKPVDRMEWGMTPPTVNAYNDGQLNTINFPAGILQPPDFEAMLTEDANYGAIGTIIGHEITHGFDDQGRQFDAKGNLKDWWTAQDASRYEERGKCIADEYTEEVPGLGVKTNGKMTQGEDTADNGGLRIAMMALEDTYKKAGKSIDEKGPDGWTPRQRFFLAHAFSWCGTWRPDFARMVITTNPHSLPEFRVNNVEANFPEFQQAFGCKAGQRMVRLNACRVW